MDSSKKRISALRRFIPWIILGVSIGCIMIGILREEHVAVLKKAINICLECIGIG